MVAHFDMELEQIDVKKDFLHGDVSETIYMQHRTGFEIQGMENWVCHVKRSLNGLKQSLRQWHLKFDSFMLKYNHVRRNYDSCFLL